MDTKNRSHRRADAGFTLLEMMIVLVIIGVLGGVVALNLASAGEQAKTDVTMSKLKQVSGALDQYYMRYNGYPQDLVVLLPSGVNYLNEDGNLDGWKNPMELMLLDPESQDYAANKPYVIFSAGPDQVMETVDDLYFPEENVPEQ